VCGYSKHVAVCHIKPVHSFKDGTPAHKINSLSNLCYLCPNCHWSFDHDMLNTVPPSLAELERGGPFPMKRIKVKPVEDGLALIRRMPYGVRRIR
jgi:hypothetical protein